MGQTTVGLLAVFGMGAAAVPAPAAETQIKGVGVQAAHISKLFCSTPNA